MVKPVQKAEVSSFAKGFLTEYSALNFPSDASIDEENFVLNKDGSRQRRKGIEPESGSEGQTIGISPFRKRVFQSFKWFNAGNNTNNEFIVVQCNDRIDIFNNTATNLSSTKVFSHTFEGLADNQLLGFSSIEGLLVITSGKPEITIIEYNDVAESFTVSSETLKVRDLWGITEVIAGSETPNPLPSSNVVSYWKTFGSGSLKYYILYFQEAGVPVRLSQEFAVGGYQGVMSDTACRAVGGKLNGDVCMLGTPVGFG